MTLPPDIPDPRFFSAVLQSPRLTLRPYSEDRDLNAIAEILTDNRVLKSMGLPPSSVSTESIRETRRSLISRPDAGDWTILPATGDESSIIGEIGISEWDRQTFIADIFAALHPGFQRMGYGSEAVSTLAGYIFETNPIATVRVQTIESNKKAVRMAVNLGFRITGTKFVPPDPDTGFPGGNAVILDLRMHDLRAFDPEQPRE